MKRGEIYYVARPNTIGAEIPKSRPGIIVSSNEHRAPGVVEVVYLTSHPKDDRATHVDINATGRASVALCEQIDMVAVSLIGDYRGTCSAEEMRRVNAALLLSLELTADEPTTDEQAVEYVDEESTWDELERVKAERDRYAKMLDLLMEG